MDILQQYLKITFRAQTTLASYLQLTINLFREEHYMHQFGKTQ